MLGRSHIFLGITSALGGGGVNMSCSRTQHGGFSNLEIRPIIDEIALMKLRSMPSKVYEFDSSSDCSAYIII